MRTSLPRCSGLLDQVELARLRDRSARAAVEINMKLCLVGKYPLIEGRGLGTRVLDGARSRAARPPKIHVVTNADEVEEASIACGWIRTTRPGWNWRRYRLRRLCASISPEPFSPAAIKHIPSPIPSSANWPR